jgi:predicted adenine nucleotide alpha hydrolase (AANH) superfamily ATPase
MPLENALLLHACCGPCSITPVLRLRDMGLEPTLFFYNPNIHPLTEYLRRREGLLNVAARLGAPVILPDAQPEAGPGATALEAAHPGPWLRHVAPLVGQADGRCRACYALRLEQTARAAETLGFARFSTTLLYSKYQKHEAITLAGEAAATPEAAFFYEDFRPGWSRGITLSKEWGIYRQQYCGCILSEYERYKHALAPAKGCLVASGLPE